MAVLTNKIDFIALASVTNANPNGDPLNGNRPRTNYSGYGEISDVCIKRKLRNRLQDMGESIFVQSADRADDGFNSLSDRASKSIGSSSKDEYAINACEKWMQTDFITEHFFAESPEEFLKGERIHCNRVDLADRK